MTERVDGWDDQPSPREDKELDRRGFFRDLASGIAMVAFILWITFFSTEGFVEIATLAVAVAMLIWFASVEPDRLMDGPRQPSVMLFTLGGLAVALVLTAAVLLQTGTLLFVAFLTLCAVAVGFVRALNARYRQKPGG